MRFKKNPNHGDFGVYHRTLYQTSARPCHLCAPKDQVSQRWWRQRVELLHLHPVPWRSFHIQNAWKMMEEVGKELFILLIPHSEYSLPPNTKRPPNTKNRRPDPISKKIRLANLIFNWSPLENNLKINLQYHLWVFPLILKTSSPRGVNY